MQESYMLLARRKGWSGFDHIFINTGNTKHQSSERSSCSSKTIVCFTSKGNNQDLLLLNWIIRVSFLNQETLAITTTPNTAMISCLCKTLTERQPLFKDNSRMFWYSWRLVLGITWMLSSCTSCARSMGRSCMKSLLGILSFIWESIMAESWTKQINILSSKSAHQCCRRIFLNPLTIKNLSGIPTQSHHTTNNTDTVTSRILTPHDHCPSQLE